jgi:serine/threonine-protein kinase RsbW
VSDLIGLRLPARPELMALVRFAAATLAAQAEFSIDEIDDLKLATDEMCMSLMGGGAGAPPLALEFSLEGDSGDEITISCRIALSAIPAVDEDDPRGEWSLQILDALVDDHGREVVGDECRAWLRKRRGTPAS